MVQMMSSPYCGAKVKRVMNYTLENACELDTTKYVIQTRTASHHHLIKFKNKINDLPHNSLFLYTLWINNV